MATLSYAYADGVVVIEDLATEAHPMVHDLCGEHAGRLTVPRGWELVDERSPQRASPLPDLRSVVQLDLIGA